jgi:hypothetical protein
MYFIYALTDPRTDAVAFEFALPLWVFQNRQHVLDQRVDCDAFLDQGHVRFLFSLVLLVEKRTGAMVVCCPRATAGATDLHQASISALRLFPGCLLRCSRQREQAARFARHKARLLLPARDLLQRPGARLTRQRKV